MHFIALLLLLQDPVELKIDIEKREGKDFPAIVTTTENYRVETSADEETARETLKILEEHQRLFMKEFGEMSKGTEKPMQVRLYKTRAEFMKANPNTPPGMGGFYNPAQKTLFLPMKQPAEIDWKFVLRHEATHQLLHLRFGMEKRAPIWFNEGFTSYWATARMKGDKIVAGSLVPKLAENLQMLRKAGELLPLKKLVSSSQYGKMMKDPKLAAAYYAQGWALSCFLRRGVYADKFEKYMLQVRDGTPTFDIFLETFEIKDADAFETEFTKFEASMQEF